MSKHKIGEGHGAHHVIDPTRLDENSVIVDAGACEGWIIQNIRHLGIKSKIYAIEPDERNIEKLKELEVIPKALVGKKRKVIYYPTSSKPEWGNIHNNHKEQEGYEIDTITLDEFDRIDYLKMVIEGCEKEVIENLPFIVPQISVQPHQGGYEKVLKILESFGYETMEFPYNEIYAFT